MEPPEGRIAPAAPTGTQNNMEKAISTIVFTMNRPLQLEGYLRSLRTHIGSEFLRVFVVYKEDRFDAQYRTVFEQHPCTVIRERNFHRDVLDLFKRINTRYVLFGVDDVVYFDTIDFEVIDRTFEAHGDDAFGFSFRFSADAVRRGGDAVEDVDIGGACVHRFRWTQGATDDTRYPFELSSTVYSTALVRRVFAGAMSQNRLAKALFAPDRPLMRGLSRMMNIRRIFKRFGFFFSPNNLESWNCRWCQQNASQLPPYTYFQRLCASAIQVNMVNTVTRRKVAEANEFTVESLNERFKEGYRLDIDFVAASRPTIKGCGREFFRLKKLG